MGKTRAPWAYGQADPSPLQGPVLGLKASTMRKNLLLRSPRVVLKRAKRYWSTRNTDGQRRAFRARGDADVLPHPALNGAQRLAKAATPVTDPI